MATFRSRFSRRATGAGLPQRAALRRPSMVLRPLATSLALAFPVLFSAPVEAGSFPKFLSQGKLVRMVTPPPPKAVPVPGAQWLKNGTEGVDASHNYGDAKTSGQLVVSQNFRRAIYQWDSFDIGADASLTVNMAQAGSSALNLVKASTDPSRIYGRLQSNGELVIVQRGGVWFGPKAQVNVSGLFASTLGVNEADFLSGLTDGIVGTGASFAWSDGEGLTFDHDNNYVVVESGATIATTSGGRVFLMAKKVENAGVISTPDGQAVLAAGDKVYLNSPSNEKLYASEANYNVPALRGLLVEVDNTGGVATNLGTVMAERGNVTIVGHAVNQMGRVSATTSVDKNGSVFLQARSGVTASDTTGTMTKRATQGGALTLGPGSTVEIAPDTQRNATGAVPTSDGNVTFTRSRIELAGQTIDFKTNAAVHAPGAVLNVRAEDAPNYEVKAIERDNLFGPASSQARITLGAGVRLDVSGTTSEQASVERFFVTTGVIGTNDLASAPLQKLGPVYQSKLTFDLREDVPILGLEAGEATNPYLKTVKQTVNERLASGGQVLLSSTGAVVTHESSRINVSGGQVAYTGATVNSPSTLVAADGTRYSFNDAPADILYTGVSGQGSDDVTRWGEVTPPAAQSRRYEAGYTEGRDAGSVQIVAPTVVLDGQVSGGTVVGQRQAQGLDALAKNGRLELGTAVSGASLGNVTGVLSGGGFDSAKDMSRFRAVLGDLRVSQAGQSQGADAWAGEDGGYTGTLPTESRVSAGMLNASGLGELVFTSDGNIVVEDGAHLVLPDSSAVTLQARGAEGITLGGDIVTHGGTVKIQTADANTEFGGGRILLKAGRRIDVSGTWVNRYRDGAVRAAVAGGDVTLASAYGLQLEAGSAIDVSGGATVQRDRSISGTDAGSIKLESNNTPVLAQGQDLAPIQIGATLSGYSMAQGGSLRIQAGEVTIRNGDGVIRNGTSASSLELGSGFFQQGGFADYDIAGIRSLEVTAGTVLAPRVATWRPVAGAYTRATGTRVADAMRTVALADGARDPVNLKLSSVGQANNTLVNGEGVLKLAAGARIDADARSTVTLLGGNSLLVDGEVRAAGGTILLGMAGKVDVGGTTLKSSSYKGVLRVGSTAKLDVSGTTLLDVDNDTYNQGQVLDGGSIRIDTVVAGNAGRTEVELQEGAQLLANGAVGVLDVKRGLGEKGPAMRRNQTVASNGGSIAINLKEGGGHLGATMSAQGGNGTASGGGFALSLAGNDRASLSTYPDDVQDVVLHVQEERADRSDMQIGHVTVSLGQLRQAGFADVTLKSADHLTFEGPIDFQVARTLTLDAPLIAASQAAQAAQASIRLAAGTALRMGAGTAPASVPNPDGDARTGTATLNLASHFIELYGQQALQGFGTFNATSGSELRLTGVRAGDDWVGSLHAPADVTLSARQVVASTAAQYTLDASDHKLTLTGGDAQAATPLSAGAKLSLKAQTIESLGGVVLAPFGSIDLAADSITMGQGSLFSVAGSGITVPYGTTVNEKTWYYGGQAIEALPEKTITLTADTISQDGSSGLDLSGGGELIAWEFVKGSGGPTDIFTGLDGAFAIVPGLAAVAGYAPTDGVILAGQGGVDTLQLGRQITFGAGGPVPAGTYTILPARYALLQGGYLIRPADGVGRVAQGYSQARPDGSYLVGATTGYAQAAVGNQLPAGFVVMARDVARRYSEIRESNADEFFSRAAQAAGKVVPRLARDAGTLNIASTALTLEGRNLFNLGGADGRGGEINLAADRIRVGSTLQAEQGVLNLSVAQLNRLGESASVLLGGKRGGTSDAGRDVTVTATEISVDTAGQTLSLGDLILAANDTVRVADGSAIVAGAAPAVDTLVFQGDGALLRVSGDEQASSVRTGATQAAGTLEIGEQVVLRGGPLAQGQTRSGLGGITAEATQATTLADSAVLDARAITLGAGRVAVGEPAAETVVPGTLVLTDALTQQVGQAQSLTLRSFSSIDFHGRANLGSSQLAALTLDSAALSVATDAGRAQVTAGGVTLANTTGAQSTTAVGTGKLVVQATGTAGGDGHVRLAGPIAVTGAVQSELNAAGSVVLEAGGSLAAGGDLTLTANTLTAARGAQPAADALADGKTLPSLQAAGVFRLQGPGTAGVAATPGAGARVEIVADRIEQMGHIALPAGALTLKASGSQPDASGNAIVFGADSRTDLAGYTKTFDGVAVSAPGGDVVAQAALGHIQAEAGSVIDVSAAAKGSAGAGSLRFEAPQGDVKLDGRLVATSGTGQTGGSLTVDSLTAVDLTRLATTLAAEQGDTVRNFAQALSLRNRTGSQTVAAGTTLAAQSVKLVADDGILTVNGMLNASATVPGGKGGSVTLAAGKDLVVSNGAQLLADAGASPEGATSPAAVADGGTIALASEDGTIKIGQEGTAASAWPTVSAKGANGGANGSLSLRARRNAADTDVRIDPLRAQLAGVDRIDVSGVKVYENKNTVNQAFINTALGEAQTFAAQAAAVAGRLAANLSAADAAKLRQRGEVEARSTGSMTVSNALLLDGTHLTLRAGGNLNVNASISDGFRTASTTTTAPAPSSAANALIDTTREGSTLRLVGGADTTSADVLATVQSDEQGDVNIGRGSTAVIVRTTTGDIRIAAGRDVNLASQKAVVYTTGRPVDDSGLAGYVGASRDGQYLFDRTLVAGQEVVTRQGAFLTRAGNVSVNAARDVNGSESSQTYVDWWWRNYRSDEGGALSWWSRYDKFEQGLASFGGGDVSVQAGRNAVNVAIASPSSGYRAKADTDGQHAYQVYAGGDVALRAGQDVIGGIVLAAGTRGSVEAGRNVRTNDAGSMLNLRHGDTRIEVMARQNLTLGEVSALGLDESETQASSPTLPVVQRAQRLTGLAPNASLVALAVSGDLVRSSSDPEGTSFVNLLPSSSLLASLEGDAHVGAVFVQPAADATLALLAGGSLDAGRVIVRGASALQAAPNIGTQNGSDLDNLFGKEISPLSQGAREPVRLVAASGDVAYQTIESALPLRVLAGRDIAAQSGAIRVQHQSDIDMSLLQAGRDVLLPNNGSSGDQGDLEVLGPGQLIVLAGRKIDLQTSGGIVATGNRNNAALPDGSAGLTVLAGVTLADYAAASAQYFQVLGGAGLADFAADLAAQLAALQAGQALPGLGSAAAQSFAALDAAGQLAQARSLGGEDAWLQALATAMRRQTGDASLTAAQAQVAYLQLGEPQRAALSAGLAEQTLVQAWTTQLGAGQQAEQVVAMAATSASRQQYLQALQVFVAAVPAAEIQAGAQAGAQGRAVQAGRAQAAAAATSPTEALQTFATLSPERQLLFVNEVLVGELRSTGRAAASAGSADEKRAIYQRGLDALATVFAQPAPSFSDIEMGASQLKTLQGSGITAMAPHGGMNVGELVGVEKAASNLGITTASGGPISIAVQDSVAVNQSRVFTVGEGDLLMWASRGDLNAGKGGSTVVGAPAPVYLLQEGKIVVDTSGSFSGSGIAVLGDASALELYAPNGTIDTGDAGIRNIGSQGITFLDAQRIQGPNLDLKGAAVGAPTGPSIGNAATALSGLSQAATKSGMADSQAANSSEERTRRNVILDFLGFGSEDAAPSSSPTGGSPDDERRRK